MGKPFFVPKRFYEQIGRMSRFVYRERQEARRSGWCVYYPIYTMSPGQRTQTQEEEQREIESQRKVVGYGPLVQRDGDVFMVVEVRFQYVHVLGKVCGWMWVPEIHQTAGNFVLLGDDRA